MGRWAQGIHPSQKLHKNKKIQGWGHFNFAFMQKVQIPTFYFWPPAGGPEPLEPTECIFLQNCIKQQSTHTSFGQGSLL